jgi:hypothetical protein
MVSSLHDPNDPNESNGLNDHNDPIEPIDPVDPIDLIDPIDPIDRCLGAGVRISNTIFECWKCELRPPNMHTQQ